MNVLIILWTISFIAVMIRILIDGRLRESFIDKENVEFFGTIPYYTIMVLLLYFFSPIAFYAMICDDII